MKLQQAVAIFEVWLQNESSVPIEKVKEAAAYMAERFLSGSETHLLCTYCEKRVRDCYMLTDEMWKVVHPQGYKGHLHVACVEKILGRYLCAADFKEDVPVNAAVLHVLGRHEA